MYSIRWILKLVFFQTLLTLSLAISTKYILVKLNDNHETRGNINEFHYNYALLKETKTNMQNMFSVFF